MGWEPWLHFPIAVRFDSGPGIFPGLFFAALRARYSPASRASRSLFPRFAPDMHRYGIARQLIDHIIVFVA
jgi:hypothetical protein